MQLKDLAAALGISAAMVSKLKKRGMPTASVEAATKWRRRHLEPARTKGMRAGTQSGHVSNPLAPSGLIGAVLEIGLLAADAIERGAFESIAPALRAAMAQVPPSARPDVRLPLEVWDALTASIPRSARVEDSEQDPIGTVWYQIALGDLQDGGTFSAR